MPKFKIVGALRDTGKDVSVEIEADSFRDAERKANEMNIVVADVLPVADYPDQESPIQIPSEPQSSVPQVSPAARGVKSRTFKWKGCVVGLAVAVVLIFSCFSVINFDFNPTSSPSVKDGQKMKPDRQAADSEPSSRAPKSSGVSRQQDWYVGGTLHRATVSQWRGAFNRDKLATSADWCAVADNSVGMSVLKVRAISLVQCIDIAVQDGYVDSQSVSEIASMCIILLEPDW